MRVEKSTLHGPEGALKFEKELQRLRELAQLKSGWDGFAANPLSSLAVASAVLAAFEVLSTYGEAPNFIAPIPDGGVQVEWESGESALELTIGPDGYKEILLVLNQNAETPEVQECEEALESSACFEQALQRCFAQREHAVAG